MVVDGCAVIPTPQIGSIFEFEILLFLLLRLARPNKWKVIFINSLNPNEKLERFWLLWFSLGNVFFILGIERVELRPQIHDGSFVCHGANNQFAIQCE